MNRYLAIKIGEVEIQPFGRKIKPTPANYNPSDYSERMEFQRFIAMREAVCTILQTADNLSKGRSVARAISDLQCLAIGMVNSHDYWGELENMAGIP